MRKLNFEQCINQLRKLFPGSNYHTRARARARARILRLNYHTRARILRW